ncbi:undecaprenyldiphospho-muramoylpentapeptide beta-N-acetylglucosaminyltransferase [Sporolactobacillus sp. THM7-4]|nr:undecaprenyldiphospho-muramoylpentapeptide beta-N-acetylglucosaminyltransferase [Sporolactobacillus sp. THM7-4]
MRVLFSGGGTGGHIYPAMAVINHLKKTNPDTEFLYVGAKNGLEKNIVSREGIPFESLNITGFKRKLSFENVKTVVRFLRGVSRSKKLIKDFRPDVIVGTGGYVCGPVVYAGARLGIPTIINEQNSVPGLTNKFLSRYVNKIAICLEAARSCFPKEKVVLTGNPRASEVITGNASRGRASLGLSERRKTVLIVGGSRGARPINEAVLEILGELKTRNYQVVYVTGEVHYDKVIRQAKSAGNPENVKIVPFIHQMPDVLAATDLTICRAGATSIAELTALGVPSVLIPSPYVTNNHQEKNARAIAANGAAKVLPENEMDGQKLLAIIDELINNPAALRNMHEAALKHGKPNAADEFGQLIVKLADRRKTAGPN